MVEMMKKRWIALYVENNVGVLAKISGLFSGKAYNLESLTVGTTEDPTLSRMTIGANCTDEVFEQLKKQLNRMVDIIKVIDLTDMDMIKKELLFIRLYKYPEGKKNEIMALAGSHKAELLVDEEETLIFQSVNTEEENDKLIHAMAPYKEARVIRGGSVAVIK